MTKEANQVTDDEDTGTRPNTNVVVRHDYDLENERLRVALFELDSQLALGRRIAAPGQFFGASLLATKTATLIYKTDWITPKKWQQLYSADFVADFSTASAVAASLFSFCYFALAYWENYNRRTAREAYEANAPEAGKNGEMIFVQQELQDAMEMFLEIQPKEILANTLRIFLLVFLTYGIFPQASTWSSVGVDALKKSSTQVGWLVLENCGLALVMGGFLAGLDKLFSCKNATPLSLTFKAQTSFFFTGLRIGSKHIQLSDAAQLITPSFIGMLGSLIPTLIALFDAWRNKEEDSARAYDPEQERMSFCERLRNWFRCGNSDELDDEKEMITAKNTPLMPQKETSSPASLWSRCVACFRP